MKTPDSWATITPVSLLKITSAVVAAVSIFHLEIVLVEAPAGLTVPLNCSGIPTNANVGTSVIFATGMNWTTFMVNRCT
jgi:hypothetical protein